MKKLFSFFILFLFVFVCYGQEDNGNIRISRNHNGIIRSVEILDHEEIPHVPKSAKEFFEKFLQIGPDDDFIIEPHVSKRTEFRHEHYNQYFRKIKVECGGYNFHFKNDKLYFASGNYIKIDSLNTQPSISPERAEELFAKHKNIPLNSIIESHSELLVRELSTTKIKEAYPYLIFKVYILSDQLNNTEYGIIDAHTGEVLLQEPFVINYSATGTFATRYNSTKQSMTQYYNSDFHLVDSTRGAKIYTRNLDGSTNYNDVIELSDDDNNWTSAEHSSSENDMGLDVHWGFQQIYDYLLNNHGFNSFNDNGYPIVGYIHYGLDIEDKDNAGYDLNNNLMYFGDGADWFRPVASLDAVAHEFGHGISDFQCGWIYSGILATFHEGLSDIWGSIMDYRVSSQQPWKIGEQIDLSYGCIRNIQNTNDSNARFKIADTYNTPTYNGGDQYVKSGVLSHWFYLLVCGGTGTNGIGNTYNVYGVGMDMAEDLIVEAIFNNYLDNVSTYEEVRTAFKNAAYALSSQQNSILVNQVENAWYAVGVGTKPSQMSLTGPWLLCSSGHYYTLHDPPFGTLTWQTSSNIQRLSTQGSNPCNFKSISSGWGWIQASIDGIPGPKKIVWSGKFESTVVTGTAGVCPNSIYTYTAQVPGGDSSYTYSWTYPSNWYYYSQYKNTITLQTPSNPYYGTVRVAITNSCGTSEYSGITVYPGYGCGGYYSMYPNPASDEITITINEPETIVTENEDISGVVVSKVIPSDQLSFTIRIYNSLGTLVSTATRTGTSFKIPLINLRDGTYIVELSDGKNSYRELLIVKHD